MSNTGYLRGIWADVFDWVGGSGSSDADIVLVEIRGTINSLLVVPTINAGIAGDWAVAGLIDFNGNVSWMKRFQMPNYIKTSLCTSTHLFIAFADRTILCLSLTDGSQVYCEKLNAASGWFGDVCLDQNTGTIYAATKTSSVQFEISSIDITGTISTVGSYTISASPGYISIITPLVLDSANGKLYFANASSSTLYAEIVRIDIATGAVDSRTRYSFDAGDTPTFYSYLHSMAIVGTNLYVYGLTAPLSGDWRRYITGYFDLDVASFTPTSNTYMPSVPAGTFQPNGDWFTLAADFSMGTYRSSSNVYKHISEYHECSLQYSTRLITNDTFAPASNAIAHLVYIPRDDITGAAHTPQNSGPLAGTTDVTRTNGYTTGSIGSTTIANYTQLTGGSTGITAAGGTVTTTPTVISFSDYDPSPIYIFSYGLTGYDSWFWRSLTNCEETEPVSIIG